MAGVRDFWAGAEDGLRTKLLPGSVGRIHLLDCLSAGFEDAPEVRAARLDMAATAFAEDPLEGSAAQFLAASGPVVPPDLRRMAGTVAALAVPPENLAYFQRLAARRDYPKLRGFLRDRLGREPDNLFWRRQALAFSAFEGDGEWTAELTAMDLPEALGPVAAKMRADAALLAGDPDRAEAEYRAMGQAFGAGFLHLKLAAAALEKRDRGDREDRELAMIRLGTCLRASPWRTNALLQLADMVLGRDRETAPLDGPVVIFLYTFNKAAELGPTLESLFTAETGNARIAALDNGSTDHTAQVLDTWAEVFGPKRFTRIDLPVNVGAPAARNWLKALPATREAKYALYLDDDALVPRDFLARFGAAVRLHPDAGVWGCKVADHAGPRRIQSADLHLMHPRGAGPVQKIDFTRPEPNPFRVTDLHIQELDLGQFDYLRPCVSVTGCCHLFRTETLREIGDFSISLSPSQYDDMEHDLKTALAGRTAVYTGHLRVLHKKRSGAASLTGAPEQGNALGNKYKMQCMHPPEDIARIMESDALRLRADLMDKAHAVDEFIDTTCPDPAGDAS